MTLPSFCGIGVPRAGTTWLYSMLASHPDVYVPSVRKEIHFFDWHYERGLQWYEKQFPKSGQASRYLAIGEFTPHYLYDRRCPERMAAMGSISRLLLIIRNPVDRAYSHFAFRRRSQNYSGSFESYLLLHPEIVRWGFYSSGVAEYLRWFGREQILVMVFEEAVSDVVETKRSVARFLGVSSDRFPLQAGKEPINRSLVPKAPTLYGWLASMNWYLRRRNLDWLIRLLMRLPIKSLLVRNSRLPPMAQATRDYLQELYEDDLRQLESLLNVDLQAWRS
jgi:hypothetical protein